MTNNQLLETISSLEEWEEVAKEATAMVESIKDSLKAEMVARETEEIDLGTHIMRYTTILSNRFDSTAFKKVMPDVYKSYTKQVTSRRFTISN